MGSIVDEGLSGENNVEILAKLPCEKSLQEQLEVMELYTQKHKETEDMSKGKREIACMRVLYPRMFRKRQKEDLFVGRYDALPIGFGAVTSLGGVGHYCVFGKLNTFQQQLEKEEDKQRVDALIEYWNDHDLKAKHARKYNDKIVNKIFSKNSLDAPIESSARLSGMMLDYNKLVEKGIKGLREETLSRMCDDKDNEFYLAVLDALDLFTDCCDYLAKQVEDEITYADKDQIEDLKVIVESLRVIREEPPKTFHQAIQIVWLYAILAGIINYGRLDDVVGTFLKHDLETGYITYDKAKAYVKCLWTMIENKRTTVNGRVIVGGRGRKDPEAADIFTRIALEVCHECRYVEPQFTLRIYEDTPEDIFDKAMQCLADGATYPTLYNDKVHVPGLAHCMKVSEKEAEQYVPFGCGEMNIVGKTVGPPNAVINLIKTLNIFMNNGIDPYDNVYKGEVIHLKKLEEISSYQEFYNEYLVLVDHYLDILAYSQAKSYESMNNDVDFVFNSILMDNCLASGKPLLGGGVAYLGGCCETFGNTNTADALTAIKKLVFDEKKYTLTEVNNALLADFEGYEMMRKDMLACPKYGNDDDYADSVYLELYDHVSKYTRESGIRNGLHHYGIVIINNQQNTDWGLLTSASADGRKNTVYLNPSNNPQGGADKNGPTAVLKSISKLDSRFHLGSVQNIKFQSDFFKENMEKIKTMIKTYFNQLGGCQLMVTVVDAGALEDAMVHPEKYPDMIVRVSGFSAVFVNLSKEVQLELLSRTLNARV